MSLSIWLISRGLDILVCKVINFYVVSEYIATAASSKERFY